MQSPIVIARSEATSSFCHCEPERLRRSGVAISFYIKLFRFFNFLINGDCEPSAPKKARNYKGFGIATSSPLKSSRENNHPTVIARSEATKQSLIFMYISQKMRLPRPPSAGSQ